MTDAMLRMNMEKLAEITAQDIENKRYEILAAHVYAHMLELSGEYSTGSVGPRERRSMDDLGQLVRGLKEKDGIDCYANLAIILGLIDAHYGAIDCASYSFPPVKLQTLQGTVYIWRHNSSPLRRLKDKVLEEVPQKSRPPRKLEDPNEALKHCRFCWDKLGRPITRVLGDDFPFRLQQEPRAGEEHLRIALCPLPGSFHPLFSLASPEPRFHVQRSVPMKDPDKLQGKIREILEESRKQRIHLLVFPELMVCGDTLDHIERLLSPDPDTYPYGVVAGSFHVWEREDTRPRNEAHLVEAYGPLLTHHKRGVFNLSPAGINSEFFPSFDGSTDDLPSTIPEGIRKGQLLHFVDTRFGAITILICADLIDLAECNNFRSEVQELRPDLLIVVAMSDDTTEFERWAREFYHFGIATLIVNAACICEKAPLVGSPVCLAFAHVGLHQRRGAPPVFLRWRARHLLAEAYDYKTKAWAPVDAHNGSESCTFLVISGEREGIIIDWGPHAAWQTADSNEQSPQSGGYLN